MMMGFHEGIQLLMVSILPNIIPGLFSPVNYENDELECPFTPKNDPDCF